MRVAKDTIVRIEMTDKDDPAEVSQYFKKKFQLNNAATSALYKLLSHNMTEELSRRAEEQQAQQASYVEVRQSPSNTVSE